MKEKSILNKLQLLATSMGHRLFRNNTGSAWVGSQTIRLVNGDLLIKSPRKIAYGLSVGSGDLVGGTQIVVTQEMVGRKIFVFTNVEIKANNTRTTTEQQNFHTMVTSLGGLSIIEKFSDETDKTHSELPALIKKFKGV